MPKSNRSPRATEMKLSVSDSRIGNTREDLKQSFVDTLICAIGKTAVNATSSDIYMAVSLAIRDRIFHKCFHSINNVIERNSNIIAYFSAEYLPGPHLKNNLVNLGVLNESKKALNELGIDIERIVAREEEPGLGNGGLGRLASCFMDSMATQEMPAIGYGIRYEFGIFDQLIKGGWQVEITDKWLRQGNPWEIVRPEINYEVSFGGKTEHYPDNHIQHRKRWIPKANVRGVAYDTPILGYSAHCNILRLWKSEASVSFDLEAFNQGDYYKAVEEKSISENITKILYPNDQIEQGKELRLQQQYFFVSCSLQDMFSIHLGLGYDLSGFHKKWSIQLNDTHPAIAVVELMRLLTDIHQLDWSMAWHITQYTCSYTNHTLLPEALEKWPLALFEKLLPRHLEIIYQLNHQFLEVVRDKFPNQPQRITDMSLIDEHGERFVRMANLAALGSHKINGVAEIHSRLLRETVMSDFYELWPNKFCNVTNGVTQRRFLMSCNQNLAQLISKNIGPQWVKDLYLLRNLEPLAEESSFHKQWKKAKQLNKERLSQLIHENTGVTVDPRSLFDIQVKRIHEYKRQHLNVLHIIHLYLMLKQDPKPDLVPRTFIFGGKAAPGYYMAKLIIKLINSVAEVINSDLSIDGLLKVVFFPDFNVKNAEFIYPAADLSEQISLAGKEASGTGNMKFALNGALTIGTLDGANVEILEEVGADNFFLFGYNESEVRRIKLNGYNPWDLYNSNPSIKNAIDFILSEQVSKENPNLFRPLVENLIYHDPYLLLADFDSYVNSQNQVNDLWMNQSQWVRKSILNVARMGKFSSDRSVKEYHDQIWTKQEISTTALENPEFLMDEI